MRHRSGQAAVARPGSTASPRRQDDRTSPARARPSHPAALAVGLHNRTWQLLEAADRTPEQDDELIHGAHASRHHWGEVGAPVNLARGEWLCSRVYAILGRAEPALHHAGRCLAILEATAADPDRGGAEDWDLAAACEAHARAYAVGGDRAETDRWAARARDACASIADPADRGVIERDLATIPGRAAPQPGAEVQVD